VQDSNSNQDLSLLYHEITKEKGKPLDFWEIAALLEIYGIRDVDAKEEYGFENVFEMAKYMLKYKDGGTYRVKALVVWEELPPFRTRIFKNYIRGLAFAMPMFVQIFFTLSIGYAIWSGTNMDQAKATVIALGTFLALIMTGSSAQAIGRKGLFYLKQKEMTLAANVTKLLLGVGSLAVLIVGGILVLFNLFFEVLPIYPFVILLVFYLLLSFLFLTISVYYMFEEYVKILYFFLAGMFFVYIAHSLFHIRLPEAQFIALLILDALLVFFVHKKITHLKSQDTISEGEVAPRASILFYSLMPFYLYGLFFFIFLVADRIVAWSTNVPAKPYFIWFNVPYEVGLDWALIALVLLMGFTEISIHEFMYRINEMVVEYKYKDYDMFNKEIHLFFKKFNIMYIIFSIIIIFMVYYIVYFIYRNSDYLFIKNFFNSFTPFVYWIAAISYAFMINGLMNVLFIFSFSRQGFSVKSIVIATCVNVLVGVIVSRMFGLEYAVFGLFVGSVVFWWYSFTYTVKMLKKLEFYYYSSF
jgi:hypothetical protein